MGRAQPCQPQLSSARGVARARTRCPRPDAALRPLSGGAGSRCDLHGVALLPAHRVTDGRLEMPESPSASEAGLDRVRGWVEAAQRIVVLTGAGISTESGIPDFRGPQGVWTKNPMAEKLSNIH